MMTTLAVLLAASATLHRHLCPRQVLGVRMGVLASKLLGLPLPQTDKLLLTIVETDGCFADGVSSATNCWVGRRTLRVEDYGKVAATFVDTQAHSAIRIAPHPEAREAAVQFVPESRNRWEAQLLGYQRLPDDHLLVWQEVVLTAPLESILGRPGVRVVCEICDEEIINCREVRRLNKVICRACDGHAYYYSPSVTPTSFLNKSLCLLSS